MADDAIGYMNRINALHPSSRSSSNYAPGGVHAPHHPTPEWIEKISKMKLFDQGWNKLREQIFENQKKLGVIPANAKMTPWPKDLLKEWDQLTDDEKKLFIRQVDVFAAYVAYTDHEIGRVIQADRRHGQARQHADHLHQRRQRRQRRRHVDRHTQRSREFQRRQRAGRRSTQELL